MIITGFTDEVSNDISRQIQALKELDWKYIDLRTVGEKNVSALSDQEFDLIYGQLDENNIRISCFGSTIANWSRDALTSFDLDMSEMKNSIRHMQKAGVRFIRIMSYKVETPLKLDSAYEKIVIKNLRRIIRLAEDSGVVCLHENCETWGGQSSQHTLRLLDEVNSPALKLVYDTGNPVSMRDIAGEEPFPFQNSLQYFLDVHPHVEYLHIKDARWVNGSLEYTFPGEGQGCVGEILGYLKKHDMDIPISIEPHVAAVFHDPRVTAEPEERWHNFIEYGKRFVKIAAGVGIIFNH
jgi:sugar phosphate isomerase/epimerase